MPVEWRPNVPIAEYIARKKYDPAPLRTIPLSDSKSQSPGALLTPTPNRHQCLDDGTIEMQCSLLRQLARQENAAKGLMSESAKLTPGEYQFETKKGELAQVLYTIWGL